jgi:hypothetical protein
MTSMKWMKRALWIVCAAALATLVLAFVIIQFQQNLLRWRAERLMADMHRIRLYQSNWPDAQRLMHRWGAWGRYEGNCTSTDCKYSIELTDESARLLKTLQPSTFDWLIRFKAYTFYRWLGGRYSIIDVTFLVQDGAILRTEFYVNVQVPPKLLDFEDEGYVLMVGAKSQQALRDFPGGPHVKGSDDDLAQHPYYKAGRPGGCEGCMMVGITYSTHTPQAEIEQLTSFDMSCLTRFWSCKMPEDLLPAAKQWHIYHDDELYAIDQQSKSLPPKPCDIPVWAVARDSGTVLLVDAVSAPQPDARDSSTEWTAARVVAFLKGKPLWPVGTTVMVLPFQGQMAFPPFEQAERLELGKRYVILPIEETYGTLESFDSSDERSREPRIGLPRCGAQEDSPEVRRELEKGFAQNDNLRRPELR